MDIFISNQTYSVRRSRELVVDVEQLVSLNQAVRNAFSLSTVNSPVTWIRGHNGGVEDRRSRAVCSGLSATLKDNSPDDAQQTEAGL